MKKKLFIAGILMMTAIALVAATVFVTVAYLTSSAAVTNTFTVGNVGIKMYESAVKVDGVYPNDVYPDDPTIHGDMKDATGNNYHLLPGKTYTKDPTIYVDASSDKSILFVKIRNTIREIEYGNFKHADGTSSVADSAKPTIREQMEERGWVWFKETPTGTVYVYGTKTTTEGNEVTTATPVIGGQSIDVFKSFSIDEHAENLAVYGGAKVNITAFAIQVDGGFTSAHEAWAAIEATYPYEGTQPTGEPTT